MFIAPFDKDNVFALLVDDIADGVAFVSLMLDHNLITGNVGAVHSDVENIVASAVAVHAEAVLSTKQGLLKTFAPGLHL